MQVWYKLDKIKKWKHYQYIIAKIIKYSQRTEAIINKKEKATKRMSRKVEK